MSASLDVEFSRVTVVLFGGPPIVDESVWVVVFVQYLGTGLELKNQTRLKNLERTTIGLVRTRGKVHHGTIPAWT